MKKLVKLMGVMALTGWLVTACSNDDDTVIPEIKPTEILVKSSNGTYVGADQNKGKFKVQFKADEVGIELNLVSDLVADKDLLEAVLKPNVYEVNNSNDLYTITSDSYLQKGDTQVKFASGKLNVIKVGDSYTIEGVLVNEKKIAYDIKYTGAIDIEPIYATEYEIQNGWYWGDNEFDYPNVGEYQSFFTQGEADKYGELEGDGYHISLSFFDEMAPKAWEASLPNKTYKASTKIEPGTFHVATKEEIDNGRFGFALFQHNDSKNGIEFEKYITDGTIKVMNNAKGQEIRFNIVLQDGTRHIGKYTGKVKQGDQFTVTTLREDRVVGSLDYGFLEFKGKSPISGKENNRWDIYLVNKGVTVDPDFYWETSGTGELLRISVFTDLNTTTDIPVGTFPIGEEKAGNVGLGGGLEAGLDFGTWYFQLKADNYANFGPIKKGSVTIAKEGATYTIKVDGVDDRANKITANYSAPLTFVDHARKPSLKQPQNQKTIKSSFGKGKLFDATKKAKSN